MAVFSATKLGFRANVSQAVALMVLMAMASAASAEDAWSTPPANDGGPIVLKVVMVEDEDEDPVAAGKAAAQALQKAMGDAPLQAVILSECFEDREYKEELIKGVCSVLPDQLVLGGATYGSFTQEGCTDFDSVGLLGIGGDGISVATALVTELGTSKLTFEEHESEIKQRLRKAGKELAKKIRKTDDDRLLIVIPDAHSPKCQYLVEGAQQVLGNQFPITGGCVNKNAGQTFVYYGGKLHEDAAVAVMLSGDFRVSLAGRMAKTNEAVIQSAGEGAAEALERFKGEPLAVLAFNCAGRRSKLDDYDEELEAIQAQIGKDLPLFGCYCAGEIGPVDGIEAKPGVLSGGSGWHVMFTVIGK